MPFEDLRQYIQALDEIHELRTIDGADCERDIGALTEYLAINKEGKSPALLFDNINSYPEGFRILTNIANTPRRIALSLNLPIDSSRIELVKLWKERLKNLKPLPPLKVESGSIFEVIHTGTDVDIEEFPAPRWHELDGGRYLGTACMVITRDPEEKWANFGCYRVQVHDKTTLGLYMSPGRHGRIACEKYWANDRAAPVAVVFGQEPALWIASSQSVPYGMSEYDWTGGVRNEPVKIVSGPETGLPIPATAEAAIEGYIPPPNQETRVEGPFGEWTGYYAHGAKNEPIIKVKHILHRRNPIITGAPPMRPLYGTFGIPLGSAALWSELEDGGIHDVKGVWQFEGSASGGSGKPIIIISIKQRYLGHAKQAAIMASSTKSGAYFGRFVIVVDDDIDPSNMDDVFWALAMRCDPAESIDILRGCRSSALDPMIPPELKEKGKLTNTRAIVNACKPFEWKDEFPKESRLSDEQKRTVETKWKSLIDSI